MALRSSLPTRAARSSSPLAQLAVALAVACAPACRDKQAGSGSPDASVTPAPEDGTIRPLGCDKALDLTVATRFYDAARCLFEGPDAVQREVRVESLSEERIAIVRGRVLDSQGQALSGVRVHVLAGKDYGHTRTRAEGHYDLAVNGGGVITLVFEREGYLPAQRQLPTRWRRFEVFPDLTLLERAPAAEPVVLGGLREPAWVGGAEQADDSGPRAQAVLIKPGVEARMQLADGTESTLDQLSISVSEYTVGARGPSAMPGELPATSAYTYAVDFSIAEALSAGAEGVRFEPPLVTYLDNFLGFPAGTVVPVGGYDPAKAAWQAADSGLVLDVLGVEAGVAQLDTDGDGAADSDAQLMTQGIDAQERRSLAQRYSAGASLWRASIPHFSAWDFNWPFSPPADAESPPRSVAQDTPDGCGAKRSGSIVGCEEQSLGELFPVVGTGYALHYQSERMPGRLDAEGLDIKLSGASVPPSLKAIELQVEVLGQKTVRSFGPEPNQRTSFQWDGLDAYGRKHQGRQEATVKVGYVYDGSYEKTQRFGLPGNGDRITGDKARSELTLWSTWTGWVGKFDQRGLGLGGFSLSVHHLYDANSHVLYQGDGLTRTMEAQGDLIETAVGTGTPGFAGDGAGAALAQLDGPHGLAVAPDGSIYVSDEANNRVRKVRPDGVVETCAGNGKTSPLGEGGSALAAGIEGPLGLALSPDGTLYVAARDGRVRAIRTDGTLHIVAGGGEPKVGNGDGGPATEARIEEPHALALGADGTLYVADSKSSVIRRVGSDGVISTFAGSEGATELGDGSLASAAKVANPLGLALGPDGSLYIAEYDGNRIRKVDPAGIISTVAGTGKSGFSGDGAPAVQAELSHPHTVDVSRDGVVYFSDEGNHRIRRVRTDGVIETVAGNGTPHSSGASAARIGDQGSALAASFDTPRVVYLHVDGTLLVADWGDGRVRRIRAALPGYSLGESAIPSADATQLFRFDPNGRHIETVDTLLGRVLRSFEYDPQGRLSAIVESEGQRTVLERDEKGQLSALLAPHGQRTQLTVDARGMLVALQRPAGDVTRFEYTDGGLLTRLETPRGAAPDVTTFAYDAGGRLLRDTHPAGFEQTLTREELADGHKVTRTLNGLRSELFEVTRDAKGARLRKHHDYAGLVTTTTQTGALSSSDGVLTDVVSTQAADPRFGMLTPIAASTELKTGTLKSTMTHTRQAVLRDPADPLSLLSLEDVTTSNGRSVRSAWDAASRTSTVTSAAGRVSTLTLDERGRVVRQQVGSLAPVTYERDGEGRVVRSTQGERSVGYRYDDNGSVAAITDPLGRETRLGYDANGQLLSATNAAGRTVTFQRDPQGDITSIAPPARAPHLFDVGTGGLLQSYRPPTAGGSTELAYSYDPFLELSEVRDAAGQRLRIEHDGKTGRLITVSHPADSASLSYDLGNGLLTTIKNSEVELKLAYNGSFLTATSWAGAVRGRVEQAFNSNGWATSLSINGYSSALEYDKDGLLTGADRQVLSRDPATGLLTTTTLGSVGDSYQYDPYGAPTGYTASAAGTTLYTRSDTFDLLGRVATRTERIQDESHTYQHAYDAEGQLLSVTRDGAVSESFVYDENGNRLSVTRAGATLAASYGARDQLTQLGGTSYEYDARGSLSRKTTAGSQTSYDYDMLGALRKVSLPDGRVINYVIDGANRRVGKRVDGALSQAWLYDAQGRVAAELGPDGARLVSRFVYTSRATAPDIMFRAGQTYRLISDSLGSIRLVVDASSGQVLQRLDYDSSGRVLADSNPGFQPFGFAGGMYDRDTGFVRFGARDYDAETGRWTARDPILFAGGQSNLYAYVGNDPINYIDPSGRIVQVLVYAAIAIGIGVAVASVVMSTNIDTESLIQRHNSDLEQLNREMSSETPEIAEEARMKTAAELVEATREGRDAVNGRPKSEKAASDRSNWLRAIRGFCKALIK